MGSCKKPECKLSKSEQSLPLQRPVQSDYTLNKGSLSKQKQLAAKPIRSMRRLWMSLNSLVDSVILIDFHLSKLSYMNLYCQLYNYSSVHWHKYWPFPFRSLWCTTMSLHRRFIKEHVLITFSQFYSWSPSLCVLLQLGGALQGKWYILDKKELCFV